MELLERFVQGDLDAFESLFRQFQSEVFGGIMRIVRDRAAAEDLTVETFWRIHRAHARFDPKRSFRAWARRIASNLAFDYLRSRRREEELPEEFPQGLSPDPALQRETREQIQRAFRHLPAKLRVAAILALIEERPYEEIGETLGISLGAVKSRIFRAVRRLQKDLRRLGIEP